MPALLYRAVDLLRDARRVPELCDGLEHLGQDERFLASLAADAVVYPMYQWAHEAEWEPDFEVVFQILDLWSAAVARPGVDADLSLAIQAAAGQLRVADRRYGPAALARATPEMRRWLERHPTFG